MARSSWNSDSNGPPLLPSLGSWKKPYVDTTSIIAAVSMMICSMLAVDTELPLPPLEGAREPAVRPPVIIFAAVARLQRQPPRGPSDKTSGALLGRVVRAHGVGTNGLV